MSLPLLNSECLAPIFSFSYYSTLANARLACSQFNQIIKKYKVQRLRVKSINIVQKNQTNALLATVIPSPYDTEQFVFLAGVKKRNFRYKISDEQSIQEVLRRILTRIEHSDNIYFCNLDISDQFLLISYKFGERFWNCNHLIFQYCSFSVSTQYMHYLMNVIQPKQIKFSYCTFLNEQILSAKCLPAIPISIEHPSLSMGDTRTHLFLNDNYLKGFGERIFDVSFNFDNCFTEFTFHTIRKIVNERIERRKKPGGWFFGVIKYGNWTMVDYDNFCEHYRTNNYWCQHWIEGQMANVVVYDNGIAANIQFQMRPVAVD